MLRGNNAAVDRPRSAFRSSTVVVPSTLYVHADQILLKVQSKQLYPLFLYLRQKNAYA